MTSIHRTAAMGLIATLCTFTVAIEGRAQDVKGARPLHTMPAPPSDAAIAEQALKQTQDGLVDPAKRQELLKISPEAASNDSRVKQALGNEAAEQAYKMSSDLMAAIVQQTGGDPQKMQQIVQELQSNPHALEKYLSASQREQIRKMASDIESRKGSAPASGSGK